MLHPNQFEVNEAWIGFRLNDEPIETERDGAFNCICLMDAANLFILGTTMVPVHELEPSQFEARRLLKMGLAHKKSPPKTLFVPAGQFQAGLFEEAKRQGIDAVSVGEDQLFAFTGEAKRSFKERVLNRNRGG